MSFDKRENAKRLTPREGDSLRVIAERETAAGNPITWQEIAKFNFGTDDPATVNEFLRDELGAHKRDVNNDFVLSPDDEGRGELLIPTRFQKSGLALDKTHVIKIRRKVAPPQFLGCCSIPGTTFEFDKSFLRPSVVDAIQPLEDALAKHPDARIMIFGHTDKVGSEIYNKQLSDRRARSTFAFITDDADTWEELYNQESWGTRAIQVILKDFDDPGLDPGPADGIYGSQTRTAVRNYQEARGLTSDGVAGSVTRKKMFTEYMTSKHDVKVTPDRFMDPRHMGCGEFNPVKDTEEPHEPNRRVTFFLFHRDRLPTVPCKHGDIAPCQKQIVPPAPRFKASFRCSFFDSIARECGCEVGPIIDGAGWLDVAVFDGGGNAFVGATVRVDGPQTREAATSETGTVRFEPLRAGSYGVSVLDSETVEASFSVEVTGGQPPLGFVASPPADTAPPLPPDADFTELTSSSNLEADTTRSAAAGSSHKPQGTGSQVGPNAAVAVIWKGWGVELEEIPTDLENFAREAQGAGGGQPWQGSKLEAVLHYEPATPPIFGPPKDAPYTLPVVVHPDKQNVGLSVLLGVTHPDVSNTFEIRTRGAHRAPIIWVMDNADPVPHDAPSPVERKLAGRARLSLWGGLEEVLSSTLERGAIDDISLLSTVQNKETNPMEPDLDIAFRQSGFADIFPARFQTAIERCHAAGIQCLAGYGLVDRGEQRIVQFDRWLDQQSKAPQATADAEVKRFAKALVDFVDQEVGSPSVRFDGISFDLESFGLFTGSPLRVGQMTQERLDGLRRVLRLFYKEVADILAVDNRICAVTVGGMMSDDSNFEPGKMPSVPVVQRQALLAGKLQVYDLAKDAPNIVIRPMAYDNAGGTHDTEPPAEQKQKGASKATIPAFNSDPGQLEWHEAMTRFALDTKKLHPGQYQLGIKRFTPRATVNGVTFTTGQGGNVDTQSRRKARCTLLRPFRAGLIMFAMGKTTLWDPLRELDAILNAGHAGTPIPPGRIGQPLQVPLDEAAAKQSGNSPSTS